MADDPQFGLTGIDPAPQAGGTIRPTESYTGSDAAQNVMDLPQWNPAQFKPPAWQDITSSPDWANASSQDRLQAARNWSNHVYSYAVGNGDDPDQAQAQRQKFVSDTMDAIFPPTNPIAGTAQSVVEGAVGTAGAQASGLSRITSQLQDIAESQPFGEGYFESPGMTPEEKAKQAQPVPQFLEEAGKGLKHAAEEIAPNPGANPSLGTKLAYGAGQAAGSVAPYMVEAATGPVAPVVGAYSQGVDQAVSAADQSLKAQEAQGKTFTPDQRADILNKAAGFGSIPGAVQAVGIAALNAIPEIKALGGIQGLLAKIGIGAGTQGAVGAASQAAENYAVQQSGANPQQNLYSGLGEAALQQGLFGGAFSAAHALAGLPRTPEESKVQSTSPQQAAPISQPGAINEQVAPQGTVKATWFGLNPDGSLDTQDNGKGYFGYNTRDPGLVGVALPRSVLEAKFGDITPGTQGFVDARNATVTVTDPATGKSVEARIVDVGPGGHTGAGLDMTYGLGKELGLSDNAHVTYDINGEPVSESVANNPGEEREVAPKQQQAQQPRESEAIPNNGENIPQNNLPPASDVVQGGTEVKPQVTDPDDWISAIANRYTEGRMLSGELGEIAPGQGYATQDLINRGLKMGPEEVTQRVSDVVNGTGDPILNAAAVRAEEARLSQRSNQMSRIADANPGDMQAKINADNAFKDLTDFHNGPVAQLKQAWHAQGMSMQGEIPVDLSNFNSMREQFLQDVGRPPTEQESVGLQAAARKVANAAEAHDAAMSKLQAGVQKATSRIKDLPSYEDLKARIMQAMNDMPCPR